MSELKKCPFCGEPADDRYQRLAKCRNDKCLMNDWVEDDTLFHLDEAWNTRPIEDELRKRITELDAEVTKCHELQDSYCDRIAELEAENAELKERVAMLDVNSIYKSLAEMGHIEQTNKLHTRIAECESALISMVNQFFYSKAGENIFRHSFMSAEEEAAEYLVEHGIARWVGKNKSAICFNEAQE